MDIADAADAGLAQLTLGQIALNETNPIPKGSASDTSQEEEDPPQRTPRKRPNNHALSGDESSGKLGAEARKKTPKKLKPVTPDGPAGAAVARHQKGDGGKTTGASATSAGASTAAVTPV